ncbi:MAG: hypothetical protein Q8L86_13335 [Vicinamibacterales bacterium]|nr:hypothetical protein [Vicinamibacterales bacterium]
MLTTVAATSPSPSSILCANLASLGPIDWSDDGRVHLPEVRAEISEGGLELALQGPRGPVSLHGRRDPRQEAERWLDRVHPEPLPEALAIIGLGAGHVLDAIEARSPQTKVLALEPVPDLLRALLAGRDLRPWIDSGRLRLLAGPDYAGAVAAREALALTRIPPVLVHPVLARELHADVAAARMAVPGAF